MRKFAVLAALLSSIPLSALAQTQLIQDGDFESPVFSPPWNATAGVTVPNDSNAAHSGSRYLTLGGFVSAQTNYQTISIPSNTVAAVLTYFYNIISPGGSIDDKFYAVLRRNDGSFLATVNAKTGLDFDSFQIPAVYHQINFNLAPYAGQTIRISFEAIDAITGSGTKFNIDDVTAWVETTADIPPNDFFTNRIVIAGNSSVKFATNIFATLETGEAKIINATAGKTLWWSWTAPANGILQLNTVGSTFVSVLGAYTGSSITDLTRLDFDNGAANDDGFARLNLKVNSQSEIQIAVDGLNNAVPDSGAIVLNLKFTMDTNRPTVAITSPAANAKITNPSITVQGTANDNLAVAQVQYRLENAAGTNDYQIADGTNHWSGVVSNFVAGPNTIRVRAIDISSNISATVTRTFTYVLSSPLDLSTTGEGRVSPNYSNAFLEIGGNFTITATPASGSIFSNWTGSITATTPKLSFTMESNMVLQANFVPNPFTPVKGNYAGLFYDTNGIAISNAGYFSAVLADKGTFSSKWQFAGATYSLAGAFLADGTFSNAIVRRGLSPLTVQLQLDLSGAETITGTISDGNWAAQLIANHAHFSKTVPAPQAGSYTLVIPGNVDPALAPGGNGIGTVKVDTAGNITFAGTLGDGTKVSQRTFVSKDNQWPFFVSLYAKQGLFIGEFTFDTNQPDTDLSGFGSWIKSPQPTSKFYPAGFALGPVAVLGSQYSFTAGVPLVNWTDGQIILENGNLSDSINNGLSIDTNNKITGTNKLALSFTTATGLFHGTVINPDTGKPISVNGALLQKQDLGYGYFLGTNQTGSVFLGPQ